MELTDSITTLYNLVQSQEDIKKQTQGEIINKIK